MSRTRQKRERAHARAPRPRRSPSNMLLQGGTGTRNGALKTQMEAHPPDLILLFPYSDKRGFKTFPWFGKAHVHHVNLQDRGPDAIWNEDMLNTWFEAWDLGRRALEDGKTVACVCVLGETRSLAMAHALQPTEENKPTHSTMLALAKCTSRADMLAFAPLNFNGEQSAPATRKRDVGAVGSDSVSESDARGSAQKKEEGEEEQQEEEEEKEAPVPKKTKRPKKDLLVVFGSHEMVLTHHMHLPAGFTMETDEQNNMQVIMPKRTESNEIKSFRARLGKHLRAVGFVSIKDDDNKPEGEAQFAQIETHLDSWVRPTVDADGKNVALDKHTLKPHVDPAVRHQLQLIDPFDVV